MLLMSYKSAYTYTNESIYLGLYNYDNKLFEFDYNNKNYKISPKGYIVINKIKTNQCKDAEQINKAFYQIYKNYLLIFIEYENYSYDYGSSKLYIIDYKKDKVIKNFELYGWNLSKSIIENSFLYFCTFDRIFKIDLDKLEIVYEIKNLYKLYNFSYCEKPIISEKTIEFNSLIINKKNGKILNK